jgi:transposase
MSLAAISEVLTQPERRRRWTSEQKQALVAEMMRPGASPTQVARRYGISTGLLYTWRRLARAGGGSLAPAAPDFMPVEIVAEAPRPCEAAAGAGEMVIELPGERRIRVDRHVDAEALQRVLRVLGAVS